MTTASREARIPLREAPEEGAVRMIEVGGHRVGLYRVAGDLHALADRCPHRGARLCAGKVATPIELDGGEITVGAPNTIVRCPWHKWEFEIATGRCLVDPRLRVRRYAVRVEGADVIVTLDRPSRVQPGGEPGTHSARERDAVDGVADFHGGPVPRYLGGMKGLLERLDDGVVLGAEGYLFELERRGYLKSGPYVPEVVLDFPDAVRELHREFLRAGAEVMVAFTYYGHREKMRTIGREDDLEPLNRNALRIAREVADEGDALVAGNICNTWVYDPATPDESGAVVREMYREQVAWAVEEGADLIIAETNDYLGEALIATEVIKEAGLPAVVTYASSTHEATMEDVTLEEACRRVADAGADVVGLNCSRGPATMLPILERIREAVDVHVAAQPVPYRTTSDEPTFVMLRDEDGTRGFPIGLDPFTCTRFEMADFATTARDLGVGYIGICCGGAPHHVRSMAEALGRDVPSSRYSPDISLHPVLGENVTAKEMKFANWRD